ncbi:MAG: FkbM family methyltransferase, partial [Novosphingobium sp.]|uniref:FkbM family methyltransferase n=1 Tax=Novosphingobium sp. TaxID=1874826 RepID=UPI0032B7F885
HQRMALAQRAATRIVGDVVLDMPEFMGKFHCSARSDLFTVTVAEGAFEPGFAALLRQHLDPQRDFVDVGANIGFYTVLAAQLLPCRRVLAIEPTAGAFTRLKANLTLNGVEGRVIAFKGAASDRAGALTIHAIEGMEEFSSLGPIIHGAVAGQAVTTEQVPAETVDALVARHGLDPGMIKIDVEGAEGQVLAGARATLERHRPVVLSELSRALLEPMGSSPEAIIAQFRALDYQVIDAIDPALAPGLRAQGEVLCLPR